MECKKKTQLRALALFSGGLDSLLAIKVIQEQNIEVIALNFDTGFGSVKDKKEQLERMLNQIDAKLEIIDIKEDFIKNTLFTPKYGYGKNFNPCIDCHAKMINIAKHLLQKYDAQFIISGEVLGQRPMSQNSRSLKDVSRLSDEGGILLRPLSAKFLEPTIPEKEGWVDREKLYSIEGRSRTVQMRLADEFGITEYEAPAGGCLLTDEGFALKIRDFIKYDSNFTSADIDVLKYGRQLRLPDGAKLIIGRNRDDNDGISKIDNPKFSLAYVENITGAIGLLSKNATENEKRLTAKLLITYAKNPTDENYSVKIGEEIIKEMKFNSKDSAKEYFVIKS